MHALFITTPAPEAPLDATEGRDENDERTMDLQPGQITMLEPGEEVQTSAPADVGQTYEPFQYRTLLQVSAALGVPYAGSIYLVQHNHTSAAAFAADAEDVQGFRYARLIAPTDQPYDGLCMQNFEIQTKAHRGGGGV